MEQPKKDEIDQLKQKIVDAIDAPQLESTRGGIPISAICDAKGPILAFVGILVALIPLKWVGELIKYAVEKWFLKKCKA